MPRRTEDRIRLLHGPYHAPALSVGDRANCLYRNCDVIVTSWTDAPISWPRCKRTIGKGHPSLLVDAELVRAICTEGAATVGYWWGISSSVVHDWRKAFGVGLDNPGTVHLIRIAAQKGADTLHKAAEARRKELPAAKNIGRPAGRTLNAVYSPRNWLGLPPAERGRPKSRPIDKPSA
jgi:hypothetical protein